MRSPAAAALIAAALLTQGASRADNPGADRCASAYENAQRMRPLGKLRDAQAEALVCADPVCPRVLRQDCAQWVAEIQHATPTIVVRATGADGCDIVDAVVLLDGAHVDKGLQGVAIPLDPGPHTVRVEPPGGASIEQRVVILEGDRDRRVELRASAAGVICGSATAAGGGAPRPSLPPSPPDASRPVPVIAYVLGGSGLLEIGIGSAVAVAAFSRRSTLQECKPRCNPDDVDGMHRTFVVSDVLIGVGIVSLAAAAYFYFARPVRPASAFVAPGVFRF